MNAANNKIDLCSIRQASLIPIQNKKYSRGKFFIVYCIKAIKANVLLR